MARTHCLRKSHRWYIRHWKPALQSFQLMFDDERVPQAALQWKRSHTVRLTDSRRMSDPGAWMFDDERVPLAALQWKRSYTVRLTDSRRMSDPGA